MSNNTDESRRTTAELPAAAGSDPQVPLLNLAAVQRRMDSLQRFLSESVNGNVVLPKDQMDMVSSEIVSAIHQIIASGVAILACSQLFSCPEGPAPDLTPRLRPDPKAEASEDADDPELHFEIMELDAMELLAEHIHFCEICGKGFKRDANLRMHMRAHGNQFKTPEALAKPDKEERPAGKRRFSCPFEGCNRNSKHNKFRPLKSAICVKNHFKRSHCPKMFACSRCHKKRFSVMADLKSHLRLCGGESRWRCSCGTSFSRKDKLFGHMALFEGHMPAVPDEDARVRSLPAIIDDEDMDGTVKDGELQDNISDDGFSGGLLDGFGSIEGCSLQDVLGSFSNFDAEGVW